jgi:hypothetical protein
MQRGIITVNMDRMQSGYALTSLWQEVGCDPRLRRGILLSRIRTLTLSCRLRGVIDVYAELGWECGKDVGFVVVKVERRFGWEPYCCSF